MKVFLTFLFIISICICADTLYPNHSTDLIALKDSAKDPLHSTSIKAKWSLYRPTKELLNRALSEEAYDAKLTVSLIAKSVELIGYIRLLGLQDNLEIELARDITRFFAKVLLSNADFYLQHKQDFTDYSFHTGKVTIGSIDYVYMMHCGGIPQAILYPADKKDNFIIPQGILADYEMRFLMAPDNNSFCLERELYITKANNDIHLFAGRSGNRSFSHEIHSFPDPVVDFMPEESEDHRRRQWIKKLKEVLLDGRSGRYWLPKSFETVHSAIIAIYYEEIKKIEKREAQKEKEEAEKSEARKAKNTKSAETLSAEAHAEWVAACADLAAYAAINPKVSSPSGAPQRNDKKSKSTTSNLPVTLKTSPQKPIPKPSRMTLTKADCDKPPQRMSKVLAETQPSTVQEEIETQELNYSTIRCVNQRQTYEGYVALIQEGTLPSFRATDEAFVRWLQSQTNAQTLNILLRYNVLRHIDIFWTENGAALSKGESIDFAEWYYSVCKEDYGRHLEGTQEAKNLLNEITFKRHQIESMRAFISSHLTLFCKLAYRFQIGQKIRLQKLYQRTLDDLKTQRDGILARKRQFETFKQHLQDRISFFSKSMLLFHHSIQIMYENLYKSLLASLRNKCEKFVARERFIKAAFESRLDLELVLEREYIATRPQSPQGFMSDDGTIYALDEIIAIGAEKCQNTPNLLGNS